MKIIKNFNDAEKFKYLLLNPHHLDNAFINIFDDRQKFDLLLKEVKAFYTRYEKTPTESDLLSIHQQNYKGKLEDYHNEESLISYIYQTNLDKYSDEFIKDTMKALLKFGQADNLFRDIITKSHTDNLKESFDIEWIQNELDKYQRIDIDNINKRGKSIWDVDSYILNYEDKLKTGFTFIDDVTNGGLSKPGLHVFSASAKAGKTTVLTNLASKLINSGHNGIFISLEMPESVMMQKIASTFFQVHEQVLEETTQNKALMQVEIDAKKSLLNMGGLLENEVGELVFYELPTGSTTKEIKQIIKSFVSEHPNKKLDYVIVDYLGILTNWRNPNSDSTSQTLKQISVDLRGIAQEYKIAMITAAQTKRDAAKEEYINETDIAESFAINHTLDTLFGIVQTDEMYLNDIKYINSLLVRARGGKKNVRKELKFVRQYDRLDETKAPIETY